MGDEDSTLEGLANAAGDRQRQVTASQITCVRCGYDLSGTALGGACPECGTPASTTIRAYRQGATPQNAYAVTSMVLGIVSVAACGFTGPLAVIFGFVAHSDMNRRRYSPSSTSMANAGLILGFIGSGFLLLVLVLAVL